MKTKPISKSAIETWRKCKRQWAFRYLGGIRGAPSAAMAFGSQLHAIAEHWLTHGTLPTGSDRRACDTFVEGVPLLPAPKTVLCEQTYAFDFFGVDFLAIIDYHTQDGKLWGDHKTIWDLRKALTPEQLIQEPAVALYSFALMDRFDLAKIKSEYVYYPKSGALPFKVELELTADVVMALMIDLLHDAKVMSEWLARAWHLDESEKMDLAHEFVASLDACNGCGAWCDAASVCDLGNIGSLK